MIEDGCTSKECLKGINPDILYALQLAMNFTFIIKWEQPTGTRLDNGSWTNQIGIAIFTCYYQKDEILSCQIVVPKIQVISDRFNTRRKS